MIIFINGTSSSGKTSIARELQSLIPGYCLNFSIDSILYTLPPGALERMVTGQKNPDLNYECLEEGFYSCAKALADLGHDLILDNAVVSRKSADFLNEYLGHKQIVMIGIDCDLETLKRRELQRGDRTVGEAASQYSLVHRYVRYDLRVDSSTKSPRGIAQEICAFLRLI